MNTFSCGHCKKEVSTSGNIGTHQRNHCPFCLYSKHVDIAKGDRQETCHGLMLPLALTFKKEGNGRVGELMLVHQCQRCGRFSINRIAGDDDVAEIMQTFDRSIKLDTAAKTLMAENGIDVVQEKDKEEIHTQLFGK